MKPLRVILHGPSQRAYAVALVRSAKTESVVTIGPPSRTVEQNARVHAMIADVRRAKPEGREHSMEVWKAIFMSALGYEAQMETGLFGEPVPIGLKTSDLTIQQCSDLIELLYEYGARHGVKWREPKKKDRAA